MTNQVIDVEELERLVGSPVDDGEPVHIVPTLRGKPILIDGHQVAMCGERLDEDDRTVPYDEVPLDHVCVKCLEALGKLGFSLP